MMPAHILRKSFLFFLAILLTAFVFTACGEKDDDPDDEPDEKVTRRSKRVADVDSDLATVGRPRENRIDYGREKGGEDLRKGKAAYNIRKYDEAAMSFSLSSEQGNAEAMYRLGKCYWDGIGVEWNVEKAISYFRNAEKAGYFIDPETQYEVGRRFFDGNGVGQDRTEAVKWYRKSAEQGYGEAQYALGMCFFEGRGVRQDYSEAVKWYRKATEQGHAEAKGRLRTAEMFMDAYNDRPEAQFELAQAYENGDGDVERDLPEALKWYRRAAELGHVEAQRKLSEWYFKGEVVEEDRVEAVKWCRKAAEQGHAESQNVLGRCYSEGWGVEQDRTEAVKWYRKAAEQGVGVGQYNLAFCYEFGMGIEQDYVEAVNWYRKAAEQGHAEAKARLKTAELFMNAHRGRAEAEYELGLAYETGDGVRKDAFEAMKWYNKAADQGHAGAQKKMKTGELLRSAQNGGAPEKYKLAQAYETGSDDMRKDPEEAAKWYRMAAELGHAEAQCRLAQALETGTGIKRDTTEAAEWYRKAADQGHAGAQYRLGAAYENGVGVRMDYSEALKWYRKAADQGHAGAKDAYDRVVPVDVSGGPVEATLMLPAKTVLKMKKVEAGSFMMPQHIVEDYNDQGPRRVTLPQDFYIGETEVTQTQWKAVMGTNPSKNKGDDLPVENVTRNDAMSFCRRLNDLGKAPKGWKFALPTEMQWEYAARGGNRSRGFKYCGSNNIDEVAWYGDNSDSHTHPVGQKKPNELGLYDMNGNVDEWCQDDGLLGGEWLNGEYQCRLLDRMVIFRGQIQGTLDLSGFNTGCHGFRIVLVPESR